MEYGYFEEGNRPRKICDKHVFSLFDDRNGHIADENTPVENLIIISLLNINRDIPITIVVSDEKYVLREEIDLYEFNQPTDFDVAEKVVKHKRKTLNKIS